MIGSKSILAVITARGGSKGISDKNIRNAGCKPLLAWTIEEANNSSLLDRVVLSSDCLKIIEVARSLQCEVPFVRPDKLGQDDTSSVDVLLHALDKLDKTYDYIVLLQPTSPLRKAEDIDACIRLCHTQRAPACVSVTESVKSPYWMFKMDERNLISPVITNQNMTDRRQDLPETYTLNGAVYVAKTSWFKQHRTFITDDTMGYVMERERSLDIDTELDLAWFEFLLSRS